MTRAQKEVQQYQLHEEKRIIEALQKVYEQAREDCERKIRELSSRRDMENLQTIIYQKKYQQALKKQIDDILVNLQREEYASIEDYLSRSYRNGYLGVVYDLHNQGIPLILPIDQAQVVKAVQTDSKISNGLYTKLGEDVDVLKRSIRDELSRGIARGKTWNQMAVQIAKGMNSPLRVAINKAIRIARTEGHRIQQQAGLDSQHAAKKEGADILKQWDATLDGRTREDHKEADGQIRELDEPFDVGGEKMQAPGVGGSARNVCNCRCCLLQRARWALGYGELETLRRRAEFFELDKTKDFADFQKKYLKVTEETDKMNVKEYDVLSHTQKLKSAMDESDYDEYMKILTGHSNISIQKIYAKYADGISKIEMGKSGSYSQRDNNIVYSFPLQKYIDNGKSKFSTLAHEYGHYFDKKADYTDIHFAEIELIHSKTRWSAQRFPKIASSSDEFLAAVRRDREFLQTNLTNEDKDDMRKHDASHGVQDAIDGLLAERIAWGHGDKYYNRKYHASKQLKDHKGLQTAYKEV